MSALPRHDDGDKRWRREYPMSRLSSWRAGGLARLVFSPESVEDLPAAFAADSPPPLFVGLGSNLLVRDGGYDGVVVRTAPGVAAMRLGDGGEVYAEAGVACPKLSRFCGEHGLVGAEFFAGIPGSVGGALAMNAGCHGDDTWGRVTAVLLADGNGLRKCRRDAFTADYRRVSPADGIFYAAAWFRFKAGTTAQWRTRTRALLRHRSDTQPLGSACAGSVFCNPPNDHAGRLIEHCGLKKTRVGDAEVSDKHANFIINRGTATATDIENLIELVRARVAEKTGVKLRLEVRIVGERKTT